MSPGDRPPLYPSAPPSFASASLPYPAPNDGRAVLSLVLGLLSLVTCGLTGIPAVALGFSSRAAIQRSGGMLRGDGLAAGGIATGLAGTTFGLVAMAALFAGIVVGSRSTAHRAAPTAGPRAPSSWSAPAPAPAAPAPSATTVTIGSVRLVDLDPDGKRTFREQLGDEYRRAAAAHETLVLMTNKKRCGPCQEIEDALIDPRMQTALANVDIVRADVDDFSDELETGQMLEHTLPWFYKLDSTLHPVDAISAGEWDDNIPENMAPVLKQFITGTLRTRRDPTTQVGTAL